MNKSTYNRLKKYFITGLVILLPAALTVAIMIFFFNLLTVPFLGIVKAFFDHYHLFKNGLLFLNDDQVQNLVAQILILASLFFIVIGLGYIARWFFFNAFMEFAEYFVRKIPLVSPIYKTSQEVINTLFTSKSNSFRQVVLVPFPNKETYAIGLIARNEIPCLTDIIETESVAVFVPTTPNPTSGFILLFKQSDILYLDMRVEEAFKYVISCGLICPSFHAISKEAAMEKFKVVE